MKQRVVGAIAMASAPQVLIADEPTTALDVTIQAQILRLIAELQARHAVSSGVTPDTSGQMRAAGSIPPPAGLPVDGSLDDEAGREARMDRAHVADRVPDIGWAPLNDNVLANGSHMSFSN